MGVRTCDWGPQAWLYLHSTAKLLDKIGDISISKKFWYTLIECLPCKLCRISARKFRQQISKLRASPKIKNQLNSLYKAISKASSKMQNLYDEETNHSINKVQQKKWDDYIVAELRILEAFKTK